MKKQTQELGLIPHSSPVEPAPRRGFLGRLFTNENGHEKTEMDKLHEEHALSRRAIQLDADLARCRRQATLYLDITTFEDKSIAAISKQQKLDDLCEQIDELYADDPMTGLILKARIRKIYRGQKHGFCRKRKR